MKLQRHRSAALRGATLIEVVVAVLLLVVFFAAVFELNAVCLRYIDASKESVAALQSVQDRAETLRNLAFVDLRNSAVVRTQMLAPANAAPFAQKATEVVKISAFPTPNGVTQLTRRPTGSVTIDSVAADLGKSLVKVDVAVSWTATFGGRARREETTNIISNGTKK